MAAADDDDGDDDYGNDSIIDNSNDATGITSTNSESTTTITSIIGDISNIANTKSMLRLTLTRCSITNNNGIGVRLRTR